MTGQTAPARAAWAGPAPVAPALRPFHRRGQLEGLADFHPGNVVWRRGAVSGVVDWQAACIGPAAADVAQCRVNLLTIGTDATDRFTTVWQHAAGATYHPWADVVTIIGFLDDLRDDQGSERLLIEDKLARAAAELGAADSGSQIRAARDLSRTRFRGP